MCLLYIAVQWFFYLYIAALLGYALVSWVPSLRGRWSDYIAMVVEPVLQPLRRIIPPVGGLDLSFLVLFIGIELVLRYFVSPYTQLCGY